MDVEIRPIDDAELAEFVRAEHASFGIHAGDHDVADARTLTEAGRALAAFEGGRIVGCTAAWSLEITLPGNTTASCAGVTAAAVLPTHRRRGLFRALTERQLELFVERGEPLAALTASEATIYGRYGYGPAVLGITAEIDPAHAAFAAPVERSGELRLLGAEERALVLPEVFDRYRRAQPGEVSRSHAYWDVFLRDRERWREGYSDRFAVAHEAGSGNLDGYVTYRVRSQWRMNEPEFDLAVEELVAPDPSVRAALWRYVLDMDLIRSVSCWNLCLDEPLRWLLADHRTLRVTGVSDVIWVRLVDVAAALAGRRYATEERLVLEVEDRFWPTNTGCYTLEGGPAGATCKRTTEAPDLGLSVDALATAFLGGTRLVTLARAGRVLEHRPGALMAADAMFTSPVPPHCLTDF
jgi:predicted acetyltransferase